MAILQPGRTADALRFSPDGSKLAVLDNGQVTLWDASSFASGAPRLIRSFPDIMPIGDYIFSIQYNLAFSDDGRWLVARLVKEGAPIEQWIWDTENGQLMKEMPVSSNSGSRSGEQFDEMLNGEMVHFDLRRTFSPASCSSTVVSPDGRFRAVCGQYGLTIQIWDETTGDMVTEITPRGPVITMAFHPNSRWLAVGEKRDCPDAVGGISFGCSEKGGSLEIWNIAGQLLFRADDESIGVISLAFNPVDGSMLASVSAYDRVRLWRLTPGTVAIQPTLTPEPSPTPLPPAGDYPPYTGNSFAIVFSRQNSLWLWNSRSNTERMLAEGVSGFQTVENGRNIELDWQVVGTQLFYQKNGNVMSMDLSQGSEQQVTHEADTMIDGFSISPSGHWLVYGVPDTVGNTVRKWVDLEQGASGTASLPEECVDMGCSWDGTTWLSDDTFEYTIGHGVNIKQLGGKFVLFNLETGERSESGERITGQSPDGHYVFHLSVEYGYGASLQPSYQLEDMETQTRTPFWPLSGALELLGWSPDGTKMLWKFVTFANDSGAYLQASQSLLMMVDRNGEDYNILTPIDQAIWDVAWSPDGRTIAYLAYTDHGIMLWRVDVDGSNAHKLADLREDNSSGLIWDLKWSSDGERLFFEMEDAIWSIKRDGTDLRPFVDPIDYFGFDEHTYDLLPAIGGVTCTWPVGTEVHAGENARLWSQPDAFELTRG